jgi:uncharacterized protein (DUF2141 family)
MKKSRYLLATVLLASLAPAAEAQAALGPDAASCRAGAANPALLVNIDGFKARTGRLRVQLYGSNPDSFLAKGGKLKRIDVPVTASGPMRVCVALPAAGRYAVAVRHDLDGDNAKGDWSDGGGFSNNPKISLLSPKPKYGSVAIQAGNGVKPVDVILNYKNGLSIGPVKRG